VVRGRLLARQTLRKKEGAVEPNRMIKGREGQSWLKMWRMMGGEDITF
jgi:hypothetical protein